MPEIIDSTTITWSEASDELSAQSVGLDDGTKSVTAAQARDHIDSTGAANGLATLDSNTKVVERLSYEGAANGVATLDADGDLMLDQMNPDALKDPANHYTSLVASYVFPGLSSGRPARLYGPPSSPHSGQTPQSSNVPAIDWVYDINISGSFNSEQLALFASFNITGHQVSAYIALIWDDDDWYRIGIGRSRVEVVQSVAGVVTQITSINGAGDSAQRGGQAWVKFPRRDSVNTPYITSPDMGSTASAYLANPAQEVYTAPKIGFGHVDAGGFYRIVAYGRSLVSIT